MAGETVLTDGSVFDQTALFGEHLTPQHSAKNDFLNARRATVADLNMSKTSFGNQSRNSKFSATLEPMAKTSYTDLNTML